MTDEPSPADAREANKLLADLEVIGFEVKLAGDKLLISHGSELLPRHREAIPRLKPALIWLLSSGPTSAQRKVLDRARPPDFDGAAALVEWSLVSQLGCLPFAIPTADYAALIRSVAEYEHSRTRTCRACRASSGKDYRKAANAKGAVYIWQRCVACGASARGPGGWVSREEILDVDAVPLEQPPGGIAAPTKETSKRKRAAAEQPSMFKAKEST